MRLNVFVAPIVAVEEIPETHLPTGIGPNIRSLSLAGDPVRPIVILA